MKKLPFLQCALFIAIGLSLVSIRLSAEPALFLEPEVDQGSFATIIVRSDGMLSSVFCELFNRENKPISSSQGFLTDDPDLSASMVSLLGIPHTVSPGVYRLHIDGLENGGKFSLEASLSVRKKTFVYEEIPLSSAMSELRESDDPRKVEEAIRLMALYQQFDPANLYFTKQLCLPIDQERRTAFFGDKRKFIYPDGGTSVSVHYGIDFGGKRGTPVFAAGDGRVVMASERIITGRSVVIEHLPGVFTSYFHLDEILVNEGDIVRQHMPIGKLGATGFVTGPHLHWELRVSGVPVSPDRALSSPLIDKSIIFSTIQKATD